MSLQLLQLQNLVLFYHDGKLITENPLGVMEKLMEQPKEKQQVATLKNQESGIVH